MKRRWAAALRSISLDLTAEFERTGRAPDLSDEHRQRITTEMRFNTAAAIQAFGGRVLAQGKAIHSDLETKDFTEWLLRFAAEYIQMEMVRRRITFITEETRAAIVRQVDKGFAEGMGVAQIGKLIREALPNFTAFRANLIARTETHGAANYGADNAARSLGLNLSKEWVAVGGTQLADVDASAASVGMLPPLGDGRTRQPHFYADGQVVPMDAPFVVGGEKLMFPGDPNGSGGNIISCRCAVSHIVNE